MSTTAHKIAVMKAFEEGAAIEYRPRSLQSEQYTPCANPSWNWAHNDYRVKPPERKTIKLLAWFDGNYLFWRAEGCPRCGTRVPAEDKTIEIE